MNLKNKESWVNKMGRLSGVTEDLAMKLLGEVAYGQHIQGTRSTPMSGGIPIIITTFQEAQEFLYIGSPASLKIIGGQGFISYLDLAKLKTWISDVFGDQELADAIGEEIEKGSCYADRIGPIKQLMEERLLQCNAALGNKQAETEH